MGNIVQANTGNSVAIGFNANAYMIGSFAHSSVTAANKGSGQNIRVGTLAVLDVAGTTYSFLLNNGTSRLTLPFAGTANVSVKIVGSDLGIWTYVFGTSFDGATYTIYNTTPATNLNTLNPGPFITAVTPVGDATGFTVQLTTPAGNPSIYSATFDVTMINTIAGP